MNKPVLHGEEHRLDGGPDPIEGRWNCATPIAPADPPELYVDGVAFEGPWGNIPGYPATAYKRSLGGLRLELHVTGGEGSPGSTILTLPSSWGPPKPYRLFAQIGADGSGIGTIQVNTDRTVVFVGEVTGETGPTGAAGADGADGATWRSGSGAPSNLLGVNGDFYFRTDTDDVYQKASGTYSVIANIRGSTGAAGATGANGGIKYTYSTDTGATDPGNGHIKFNSVTLASIVALRISETDADGNGIGALIQTWDDSTSAVRETLTIVKDGAPGNILVLQVTGTITDNGAWDSCTVAYVGSAGAFSNGDTVRVFHSRTGDKGDSVALPDQTGQSGKWLRTVGGAAVWQSIDESATNLFSDVTTGDVTSTKHGFAPKSPADATKFLNGAATPAYAQPKDSDLSTSDIATNNVSTGKHGFAPKLPGDPTTYLDGSGTYSHLSGDIAPAPALSAKLYDYTVSGSDKASIDTNVDGGGAGLLSGAYDVLEVWIVGRTDDAVAVPGISVIVNNDTGAVYDLMQLAGVNATPSAGNAPGQTSWQLNMHGSGGGASYPSAIAFTIPSYAGTTFFKVAELRNMTPEQTAANNQVAFRALGYRSTSAITRVKVSANGAAKLKVGTRLLIYGR